MTWANIWCVKVFKGMLLSFLQGIFTLINCFYFILQNISWKIELFAGYWYLFSNCCLGYCIMEWFSTAQQVLIVKTFYDNGECAMQIP